MNRNEAITKFTRENASKLASITMEGTVVKKLRQTYFEKNNLDSGERFSNQDVAEAVISVFIKARIGISCEDLILEVQKIPFINEELDENDIRLLFLKICPKQPSLLKPEDLAKIQKNDFLVEVEHKFEEKARVRAEMALLDQLNEMQQLQKDLNKEKADMLKYKTELDSLPPEIILDGDIIDHTHEHVPLESPWWQDLGLETNPFVSDRGLVGVPREKWDDIFVETSFFKTQLRGGLTNPDEILFKTKLILGEYGSGKTTLINVLSNRLGAIGILPINITLNPSPNVGSLTSDAIQLIGNEICAFLATSLDDPRKDLGYIDSLPKLGMVLEIGLQRGMSTRLVIFIDGLHKGNKYLPETFEFFQQLQNIHESIENKGLSVGIIVAGDLLWKREIEKIPSISGSIFSIEIIPPIQEEDAVEAVIRRVLGFVKPGVTPPTIRKEPLRQVFRVLSQRFTSGLTFRQYLNHVMGRLNKRAYEEIGISIEMHWESVSWIQDYMRKSKFCEHYELLLKEIHQSPKTKLKLKKLLPDIYIFGGIGEHDQAFTANRGLFAILRKNGFITQRHSPKNVPFVWAISQELANVLDELYRQSKILPSEALSALFEERDIVATTEIKSIYGPIIELYADGSKAWHDSWPELSSLLASVGQDIQLIENSMLKENEIEIHVEHIKRTIFFSMKATIIASGATIVDDNIIPRLFEDLWAAPENAIEIVKIFRIEQLPTNKMQLFGFLNQHSEILKQLYNLITEISKGEIFSRISNRLLTENDIQNIHKCRIYLLNSSFKESIDLSCTMLEDKIRDTVYYLLRAAWGNQAYERVPSDIRQHIEQLDSRGHPRTKRERDPNFLYDISRSEYSKILFEKNNFKCIFGNTMKDHEKTEIKNMLELIFSLGDREAHHDRPKYFREHATEIADVIRFLPRICEILNARIYFILTDSKFFIEKDGASRIKVKFLMLENINPPPVEIQVTATDVQRIVTKLLSHIDTKKRYIVPIANLCIVDGATSENQMSVLRSMIAMNLISINGTNLVVELTEKGKDKLNTLVKIY